MYNSHDEVNHDDAGCQPQSAMCARVGISPQLEAPDSDDDVEIKN